MFNLTGRSGYALSATLSRARHRSFATFPGVATADPASLATEPRENARVQNISENTPSVDICESSSYNKEPLFTDRLFDEESRHTPSLFFAKSSSQLKYCHYNTGRIFDEEPRPGLLHLRPNRQSR